MTFHETSVRFIMARFAPIAIAIAGLQACDIGAAGAGGKFVTRDSTGIDTWASVWLVENHVAAGSSVTIRPQGAIVRRGRGFAYPDAEFARTANHTAFHNLTTSFQIDDPAVLELARHLDDIEIAPWRRTPEPFTTLIEVQFRHLQRGLNGNVPRACYDAFFEGIYRSIRDGRSIDAAGLDSDALSDTHCARSIRDARPPSDPVPGAGNESIG